MKNCQKTFLPFSWVRVYVITIVIFYYILFFCLFLISERTVKKCLKFLFIYINKY